MNKLANRPGPATAVFVILALVGALFSGCNKKKPYVPLVVAVGVNPAQPVFERMKDKAILNYEMEFETKEFDLRFQEMIVKEVYPDASEKFRHGSEEDLFANIAVLATKPVMEAKLQKEDETGFAKSERVLLARRRVIFFYPFTDYPLNSRPVAVHVTLVFSLVSDPGCTPFLGFLAKPVLHTIQEKYRFPLEGLSQAETSTGLRWILGKGGSHELGTNHRNNIRYYGSGLSCNQRYAHDILILDAQGSTNFLSSVPYSPAKPFSTFYAWDRQVVAICDAQVVDLVRDKLDTPITTKAPDDGNWVTLALPDGSYSTYFHLKKDSIPASIQKGSFVTAGKPIGRVGTSGNSSEPHLHVHRHEAPSWHSDGLPMYFENIAIHRWGSGGGSWSLLPEPWAGNGLPSACDIYVMP